MRRSVSSAATGSRSAAGLTINQMIDYLDGIRESYDRVASSYAELVQEPAAGEDEALDLLAQLAAGPVLDAGCGPGRLVGRLQDRRLRVIGIDLSPVMIELARRDQPGAEFCVGSITDLPFAAANSAELSPGGRSYTSHGL
jgi:SAM-dependent methyltransferase